MQELKSTLLKDYLESCETPPLLLDVREPWEFERCHIDGSLLLPMRQVVQSLPELDPDQETVVICHHGIRSRRVCQILEMHDFSRVINLSDGIDGWARYVDINMPTY